MRVERRRLMAWLVGRKRYRAWRAWTRTASRLSPYLLRRSNRVSLAVLCGLGYTALRLIEPWTMALVIDHVVLDRPLPVWLAAMSSVLATDRIALLHALVGAMVVLAVGRGIFYYCQQLLTARAGQEATADIRLDLYAHLQYLSFAFHDRRRTGDVLTRLTNDTRLLRDIFISLPLAITGELFLMLGMVAVMAVMDPTLTLIALTAVPAVAIVLQRFQQPMKRAVRRQREREGRLATIASEALGAIRVTQGFRRERHEIDRFGTQNRRGLRDGLRAARLEAKLHWSADVIVAVVVATVLAVATRRVLADLLSPGDLIVFVSYLRTFVRPISRVSRMAERAARGAAAGERVLDMLTIERAVADRTDAVPAPRFRGAIIVDRVSFSHRQGTPVLSELSLKVDAGERVAIVGSTGGGKSTLLSLIPRFYDPTAGCVCIDGHDIRGFTLSSLRKQISIVFQDPVLFATTVAENIGYGRRDSTMEEIVDAAERAGIHSIVMGLPDGYETVLGERGGTLSGGQRQCITIARAMIKNAPIVLFDEPLTGLDRGSADLVRRALDRLMEGRTVLLVTHDLASARSVDRVCVMEGGRLIDEGPPAAVLARDAPWRTAKRPQVREVS